MKFIEKRSGEIVPFDPDKITQAIFRAASAVEHIEPVDPEGIMESVLDQLKASRKSVVSVEHVQDFVEKILMEAGHLETAKAYILYREQHRQIRENKEVMVDVENTMTEYLNRSDWRVKANSNQGYSLGGLILNTAGKVTANYWLSHIFSHVADRAHRSGDIHIHDLDLFCGYCAGWSLRSLLAEGFGGVPNRVDCKPPTHLSSAIGQMVNFLGTMQNEWAGAQAFSSFDTYLAPYVRKLRLQMETDLKASHSTLKGKAKERYIYDRVFEQAKQNVQAFVFNLNVPSRWGSQSPFTNITLDWICPEDLRDKPAAVGGVDQKFTYGDCQPEMDMLNKAFIEVMTEGDSNGRVFTFPIPTYNITKDFDWDHPNSDLLFEMTAKYGMPYFQNFINSSLEPHMVRSMCCRLQLDLKELLMRGNGLFGSAEMTGSIGVVTLNAARIGYLYKGDKEAVFNRIGHLMDIAKETLELRREVVMKNFENGLLPYSKRYLGNLNNHFSTIGVNGLNECIRNFTDDRHTIGDEWGQDFAEEILIFMRDRLRQYQEETGNLYNLEATPAEGTTYRFAKEDQKRFEGIIQAGTKEAPYYTNSSQLPVGFTDDAFEALELQDRLQTKYTGGTVLHLYMGERISDAEGCKKLVKRGLTHFKLPYITVTPTFSICPTHGYLTGEHEYCTQCDEVLLEKLSFNPPLHVPTGSGAIAPRV
ncbi:MAG: ribonucleoside triphosphate reductase [bacterium]|nr:ribonucleoside triphosphate reductase [bacterium]